MKEHINYFRVFLHTLPEVCFKTLGINKERKLLFVHLLAKKDCDYASLQLHTSKLNLETWKYVKINVLSKD